MTELLILGDIVPILEESKLYMWLIATYKSYITIKKGLHVKH